MTAASRFVQTGSANRSVVSCARGLNAEDYMWLVNSMLRRFPHRYCEAEDLYQQGCLGLMKAIARFDPTYGSSFNAYAAAMIIGEMRMLARLSAPVHIPRTERELRARIRQAVSILSQRLAREPTIQELSSLLKIEPAELTLLMEDVNVTSADTENDNGTALWDTIPDSDAWFDKVEMQDLLQRLPERDRQLMHYRYFDGLSQSETACRLAMTQVQVSRRERVLKKLLRDEWLHAGA